MDGAHRHAVGMVSRVRSRKTMDRILCVMPGHTCPRENCAGRTTQKIYCTEELPRGGKSSEAKHRSSAVARFVQYGDCIRTLRARSERTLILAPRPWRCVAGVPPPVPWPTRHTSGSPDKCCQPRAVAQRLRTIAISLSFFSSIAKSMGSSAASETVRGERCDARILSFLML